MSTIGSQLDKLDDDFLFLLGFTKSFSHKLRDRPDLTKKCNAWLTKLCGEPLLGQQKKRIRNVYISKLILCMQEGQLNGVFLETPPEGDLLDVFNGPVEIREPMWLEEALEGHSCDFQRIDEGKPGRTYCATRNLPDDRGVCAYVAVSNGGGPECWTDMSGGGNYNTGNLEDRFNEIFCDIPVCPEPNDPCGSGNRFYANLAAAISVELNGECAPGESLVVEEMLKRLMKSLQNENGPDFQNFTTLSCADARHYLLNLLLQKLYARKPE